LVDWVRHHSSQTIGEKNNRGKTLTPVYQNHEQSYSSAHGGVRPQRGSICSRSYASSFS
jgi:hypothetical protein